MIIIVAIIITITITITVIVALLFLLLLLQMSSEGALAVDWMRRNKCVQRFQAFTAVWLRPWLFPWSSRSVTKQRCITSQKSEDLVHP
jgi:hypothetical protein